MEIVDIPGYEKRYAITKDGRIWAYPKRKGKNKNGQFLKGTYTKDGYTYVTLMKNGRNRRRINRIIAEVFIPNPENKPFVNHKNGIRDDNRVENLEWCTAKENTIHSYVVLKRKASVDHLKKYRGKNGIAIERLNTDGEYIDSFSSATQAAKILGFCQSSIYMSLIGKRPIAHGFLWKYK